MVLTKLLVGEQMSEDQMQYDLLTQKALRGVVRAALEHAAREGLPGEHHFYIAFSTLAPGIQISSRLRELHSEEMTIILQHQFYALEVGFDRFTVQLHFNNIAETLVVPLDAITGFYDPSVQFGLQFDISTQATATNAQRGRSSTDHQPAANAQLKLPESNSNKDEKAFPLPATDNPDTNDEITADKSASGGAQVVSIDKFRKNK